MNGHWRAEVLPPSDRSAEALYLQGCLLRGSGVGPAGGPWGHRSRGREVSGGSKGLGDSAPTPPRLEAWTLPPTVGVPRWLL